MEDGRSKLGRFILNFDLKKIIILNILIILIYFLSNQAMVCLIPGFNCFFVNISVIPKYTTSNSAMIVNVINLDSLLSLLIINVIAVFHLSILKEINTKGKSNFLQKISPIKFGIYLICMYILIYLMSSFQRNQLIIKSDLTVPRFISWIWFNSILLSLYTLEWKKIDFIRENTENNLDRSYELVKLD